MWWFLYGLIVGAGAMRLLIWDLEGRMEITWYAWPIGILALALAALTLQTFFASFEEREPKAAWMSLLFMGVPTLVLGGIVTWVILAA